MNIVDERISGCVQCGSTWITDDGVSTNAFWVADGEALNHSSSSWSTDISDSLAMIKSAYLCPKCGSFEVECRDYGGVEAEDSGSPLLDGEINTNPPLQVAEMLMIPMRKEYDRVSRAQIPDTLKKELLSLLNERMAEIDKRSERDSEAFKSTTDLR